MHLDGLEKVGSGFIHPEQADHTALLAGSAPAATTESVSFGYLRPPPLDLRA
ncbi:MAG: hypothetical protein AAF928_04835 [Myxococcota bacterium]